MELGKRMELHVMELFQMELQMELENTIGWKEEDYELEDYQMDLHNFGYDDECDTDSLDPPCQ